MEPASLLARIYLTADPADFLHYKMHGTLAPRSVAQAAAFPMNLAPRRDTGAVLAPAAQQQAIQEALERIFDELNEEPREQWAQDYRAAGNRSLSVGDVVVLGETAWVVAPVGYERVSADDLATAICPSAEEDAVSSRGCLPAEAAAWAQEMAQRCRARSAPDAPWLSR